MYTYKIRFDGCDVGPATDPNDDYEADTEEDAKADAKADIDGRIEDQEGDNPYTVSDYEVFVIDQDTGRSEVFTYAEL